MITMGTTSANGDVMYRLNKLIELIKTTEDEVLRFILQSSSAAFRSEDHKHKIGTRLIKEYLEAYNTVLSCDSVTKFFEFIDNTECMVRSLNIQSEGENCTDKEIFEAFEAICPIPLIEFRRLMYSIMFSSTLSVMDLKTPGLPVTLFKVGNRHTFESSTCVVYLGVPLKDVFSYLTRLAIDVDDELTLSGSLVAAYHKSKSQKNKVVLLFSISLSLVKKIAACECSAPAKSLDLIGVLIARDAFEPTPVLARKFVQMLIK